MIQLKEPLEKLTRTPQSFTQGKNFLTPSRIKIYDDTLRDGEQMPGIAFSPDQKLELATLLSDIGVHVMDVGFPVVSESDRKALQLCLQARQQGKIREDVEILAMCRALPGDIDASVETAASIGLPPSAVSVLCLSTLSDLHLKYKLGKILAKREGRKPDQWLDLPIEFFREANVKMITAAISYAREKGLNKVEFAAEDASRSQLDYALPWIDQCFAAGGTRFCFSDTLGCFTVEGVDYYFPPIVEVTTKKGRELHAHFHNDFGMGAANCVRALSHGASHAGVTANGIGERAGNTPLEQVVMILKSLYGIELPGFRYDRLVELRRAVEKYSGIPMQPHAPIVGEGVFYHESGIHTAGISINPAIYQYIPEKMVGGTRRFVFGKHTGTAAVEEVLKKHENTLAKAGVPVTEDLVKRLVGLVKDLREERITKKRTETLIREHYRNYYTLGISEEELIELAIQNKKELLKIQA
jgi:isopropylmalate/homocitrate/citramalate synthase